MAVMLLLGSFFYSTIVHYTDVSDTVNLQFLVTGWSA